MVKRSADSELNSLKSKKKRTEEKEFKTPKYSKKIKGEKSRKKENTISTKKKYEGTKDVKKNKTTSKGQKIISGSKKDHNKERKGVKDLGLNKYPQKKNVESKFGKDLKPTDEDWMEFKKKKKDLKIARKQGKDKTLYEVSVHAKQLGEKLRCKSLKGGDSERLQLCKDLHDIFSKESKVYPKLVLVHDMARIVQGMLKYATPAIRTEISKELMPSTVSMIQSKYGKFCIKRMLKYGSSETRKSIVSALYGHSVKLSCHVQSSAEVDNAYVTWASPAQKCHLQQEFYGEMYKQNKDKNVKCLADTYKDSPHMKLAILGAAKNNLQKIINKELLDNGLVHAVLFDFLSQCSVDDRNEFITSLCPAIATICSTKEGSRAAMLCVWQATNKDKKIILRSVKEHILKLAMHEFGHSVLLALLSSIDDTVILNKMLVCELTSNAEILVHNEWGRKVLLWLVAPKDTTHFHPTLIKEIEEGAKAGNSKKSQEIRAQEILANCTPTFFLSISEKPSTWLSSASIAMVTLAIVKTGSGSEVQKVLQSIAEEVCNPEWKILGEPAKAETKMTKNDKKKLSNESTEEVELLGVEHPGLHMVLKKLAQHDKIRIENSEPTFGAALVEQLDDTTLKKWLVLNRACFLLVCVYENGTEDTQNALKKILNTSSTKKILQKQNHTGGKILLKKLV